MTDATVVAFSLVILIIASYPLRKLVDARIKKDRLRDAEIGRKRVEIWDDITLANCDEDWNSINDNILALWKENSRRPYIKRICGKLTERAANMKAASVVSKKQIV